MQENAQEVLEKSGNSPAGRLPLPELLSSDEMCDIFGCSKATLYKLRMEKGLPYVRFGQKIFYLEQDVRNWLNSKKTCNDSN